MPPSYSRKQSYVPRLPSPPTGYDPKDQAEFRRQVEQALSSWGTPEAERIEDFLDVRAYGVVGDGVTDDTTAMQGALDDGATLGRPLNGANLTVKISGPLIMRGPGLVFNSAPNGGDGVGPGILVTGSGYTALTVTGVIQHFRVTVMGDANPTCNGICFYNPQLSYISFVRVVNLDGFGVRILSAWDCLFGGISVESCGNDTWYAWEFRNGAATTGSITMAASASGGNGGASAFTRASGSFLDDGFAVGMTVDASGFATAGNNGSTTITYLTATTMTVAKTLTTDAAAAGRTVLATGQTTNGGNQCIFQRLQVELSTSKAMRVDDDALSCVFCNIHSERLAASASYTGWEFSGGAGLFLGGRFHADSGTGILHLRGIHNVFAMFRSESSVDVELEGSSGYTITLIGPEFGGGCSDTAGANGTIAVLGGSLGTWSGSKLYLENHTGTWTPTLKFGGAATGMTYSGQSGTYTRTGNLVTAHFDFTLTAKGSSTGLATIGDLPYAVTGSTGVVVAYYAGMSGVAGYHFSGRVDNGTTTIDPCIFTVDGYPTDLDDTYFTNTSRIIGTITYQIA